MKKKHRLMTVYQLDKEATGIIRGGCREGPVVVDLLNTRDAERREQRQKGLLSRNPEAAKPFIATRHQESSERLLERKQRQIQAKEAIKKILKRFENDVAAKRILIACLGKAVAFRDTRTLMSVCSLTDREVISAKERIRYFIKQSKESSFEDFLSNAVGGA